MKTYNDSSLQECKEITWIKSRHKEVKVDTIIIDLT